MKKSLFIFILVLFAVFFSALALTSQQSFAASSPYANPKDSDCDANASKKGDLWKTYRAHHFKDLPETERQGQSRAFHAGLPRSSAELLKKIGIISNYQIDSDDYARLSYELSPDFDMKALVHKLTQLSKIRHQQIYGSDALDYQRLVFMLEDGNQLVFWDSESDVFYNGSGQVVTRPKNQLLSPPYERTQIPIAIFLKLAGLGFSIIGEPNVAKHDLFGHYLSFIKRPELTRLYREGILRVAKKTALNRANGTGHRETSLETRILALDEHNYFVMNEKAKIYTHSIGNLEIPESLKTPHEIAYLLNVGLKSGRYSFSELESFTKNLMKHRDEMFERFGGVACDGYNEGRIDQFPFENRSPFHQIGVAFQKLFEPSEFGMRSEADRAWHSIDALSLFLAASRNPLTLEELFREATFNTENKMEKEAFLASSVHLYFKNVFGMRSAHPFREAFGR